ncbi:MAG: hypothetical protein DSM106950_18820 [Stigonema ocellatum SAG 48.90 = DSM 106950]|nr:hypothetical protein [Stigonema ocellatum SAG 48.90 = DSM 106950]
MGCRNPVSQRNRVSQTAFWLLVLAFIGLMSGASSVAAQQEIAVCQPPNSGEYLLLVISPTPDNQTQLRRALPPELKITTCKYLKDIVTRIGGFTRIEDANRWGRYVKNVAGLSAIVTTRPKDLETTTQTSTYKPQRLGEGFAILVDYYNRPEVVTQVQQVVGGDVGFVSYGQRPYLLAVYTTNQKQAYNTLQTLSERGFFAILVDSRKVILLRSVVHLQ